VQGEDSKVAGAAGAEARPEANSAEFD